MVLPHGTPLTSPPHWDRLTDLTPCLGVHSDNGLAAGIGWRGSVKSGAQHRPDPVGDGSDDAPLDRAYAWRMSIRKIPSAVSGGWRS